MSDQSEHTGAEAPKQRKPIERTNPVVEFVSEIPSIVRGPGGFKARSSKYDAVYAALAENPGRWAYIGEGDGLYGALTGYRKRRELDDLTIANRGGKVYAGVNVETPTAGDEQDTNEGDENTGNGEDAQDGTLDEDEADRALEPPASPETPQGAATATVPADDAWA